MAARSSATALTVVGGASMSSLLWRAHGGRM
jgi:hypothetical protein